MERIKNIFSHFYFISFLFTIYNQSNTLLAIMLKHKQSDSTVACTTCLKNSNLLRKYQQLIHLYKKKQVRLSAQISSQISNGPTTCHTLECLNLETPSKKLISLLDILYKKRCSPLFRMILPKSVKKLIMLNISNKLQKYAKKEAFSKIKTQKRTKKAQYLEILNKILKKTLYNTFQHLKRNIRISAIQQIIKQLITKPQQMHKKYFNTLKDTKQLLCTQSINDKNQKRKCMQLQIINKKLISQNQILRTSLEEQAKRQAKQSQKKKQSLEMLAQQINEKNQQIKQLKNEIKAYQQTYQTEGNVLQQDKFQMRKDINHLQQIRQRLNDQIEVLKSKVQQANQNAKKCQQKAEKLQKQLAQIKNRQYQQNISYLKAQKMCTQFSSLIASLNKKLKRLNVYQKQLEQSLILGDLNELKNKQSQKVQQEVKSQIILMFLANISDPLYKLRCPNLFDEEQKNALTQHKESWVKLQNEQKQLLKIDKLPKNKRFQMSDIHMQGTNGHMDSIFQALQSPRGIDPPQNNLQSSRSSPSIRMLELQLQKKKQVQKISQLKQKFLHVRIIILKLLKSLELQQNLKSETQDILRLLFDLFEYSQSQRQSIFVRKKRMFSLF